ncbi:hypothetical protein ID866_3571 [Astraeus odoratus]|nr:hypothetical protein ID866_3571 [Astraeus odoratus]
MEKGNAHDYIEGIAQGLRYMHTHVSGPIFHGDLKGTNVLISDNGQPLLSDFSSAVAKHSVGASMLQNVGGSIRWIAPELLDDGGELTAEGDIWAFGMTALVC